MYRTDLRIGEVVSKFVSYNIPSFRPFSLKVSDLFFCLLFHITEYSTSLPLVHLRSSHMRLSSTYFFNLRSSKQKKLTFLQPVAHS